MIIVGCGKPINAALPPDIWKNAYLSIETECSSDNYCEYVVTIGPFKEDRVVDFTLFADYGIEFRDDLMSNERIVLSDDGRRATIEDIAMQLEGTRVVYIPFSVRTEDELTGEYSVDATLTIANQIDPILDPLQIKAFIQNGGDNSDDFDGVRLLRTQAEFNSKFPFSSGDKLASFVRLEEDQLPHPRQGRLYVKLVAPHANYYPVITLHGDGVEIKQPELFPIMANRGESRIVEFQFRIAEGERPRDGIHVFSISIVEEGDLSIHQTLGSAVEIISNTDQHRQQSFEIVTADIASTMGKTAADHAVGMGGMGISGTLVSGYFETVTTGVQPLTSRIEATDVNQFTGGALSECTVTPMPTLTPTLTPMPTLTPIPPEPTVMPPTSMPAVTYAIYNGADFSETAVDPRCSGWGRTIFPTSELTLLGAYHQYVEARTLEMNINHFVLAFRLCNNIGIDVDKVVLAVGEMYYLPNDNRP